MRTFTTEHTVYAFEELSKEAKDNAVQLNYDINVDYDWWQFVEADAADIGLNITEFDLDYRHYIKGNLTESLSDSCNLIIKNHGKDTETNILASHYLKKWNELVAKYSDGKNLELVTEDNEEEFDAEADELTQAFEDELLQEYFKLLKQEYEHLTSEEAIIETLISNEYEFYVDGEIA